MISFVYSFMISEVLNFFINGFLNSFLSFLVLVFMNFYRSLLVCLCKVLCCLRGVFSYGSS
jgi:hypothetical protein